MHRHMTPLLALLFLACNGPDSNINVLTPNIAVAPENIEFEDVVVLYSGEEILQVINAGRAPLKISDISVLDNDDGVFSVEPSTVELDADESIGLIVTFTPETYIDYERDLIISSNDDEAPELVVPLSGSGIDGPVPDILLSPETLDYGSLATNATSTVFFNITNAGDGDLMIGATDQAGSGAFLIQNDPEDSIIPAGQTVPILVAYTPTTDLGDNGSFTIESNDPDEPVTTVTLLGNGGGDFDYPIATIDCPDEVDPPITLTLDGSDSYDPNGNTPLLYSWALDDAPEGSGGEIADEAAETTSVFVDVAGSWQVSLGVENTIGVVSAPEECRFEAIPDDDIHIELTWNTPDSDLDLHLIQDGYEFGELDGDCCWCNPNPSWGESTDDDDPDLSLDNQAGYGPEAITLFAPVEDNYSVKAHYFSDQGGGTTTATIRIYLEGLLEHESSQVLTHNQVWNVGYIAWPDSNVIADGSVDEEPPRRTCE